MTEPRKWGSDSVSGKSRDCTWLLSMARHAAISHADVGTEDPPGTTIPKTRLNPQSAAHWQPPVTALLSYGGFNVARTQTEYKTRIKLNLPDGTFCRYLTESELRTEIRNGNVRRASTYSAKNRVYQLIQHVKASESKNTKPLITRTDLAKLVGLQRLTKDREIEDIERLIGFGLLPENAAIPAHGYL